MTRRGGWGNNPRGGGGKTGGEKWGGEKCEGGKWLDKIKEDYKERKR